MGSRPMRIIFKPYRLKGGYIGDGSVGDTYWRVYTDFPASKNGKPLYGKGIDKMSALADLISWCPVQLKQTLSKLTTDNLFTMPDQPLSEYWQMNLDGSVPTRDEWLYERGFWQMFGHLPYYD